MRFVVSMLLMLVMYASCREGLLSTDVECSECYYPEPDSADLVIYLTINEKFPEVPLIVYKGNIEDDQIEYIDTAFSTPYYLWVPVNKKYSVKAEYKKGNATLFVVDGTKLKTSLVEDECDGECYVIKNEHL